MAERINPLSIHKLLKQTVEINSIAPNEQQIAEFLEQELVERGFSVERQVIDKSGRMNLLCEKGKNSKILFSGHMDTVDTRTMTNPKPWKTDPMKLEQVGPRLYGLGASDMKGGLVAFIEAASNSDTPVKLLIAADEEEVSLGGWKAVWEKKEFFKGIELAISAEPSLGLGINSVTRGRTGRSEFEVHFTGNPTHVMEYKKSIDAFQKMGSFLNVFHANRESLYNSALSMAHIKSVGGKSVGMSIAGESMLIVEVFLGPGDKVKDVMKNLRRLGNDKVRLKNRETPYLEGYYFEDFPYRKLISKIIAQKTNKEIKLDRRTSVADDNIIATLKIPVITWGPTGGNEHKPNEFVFSKNLVNISRMYKEFLDSIGKIKQK